MKKRKYDVDGYDEPFIVTEDKEEEFLQWAKENKKQYQISESDLGNQQSSTEKDATVEQSTQASTQEIDQSQTQAINTESNLEDGSLELADPETGLFPVDIKEQEDKDKHRWLEYKTKEGVTVAPFFMENEDNAISQLNEAYPGFKFETTNFEISSDWKYDKEKKKVVGKGPDIVGGFGQNIKVTSPDGKESIRFKVSVSGSTLYNLKFFR